MTPPPPPPTLFPYTTLFRSSETAIGANTSHRYITPYLDLPSGNALLNSAFADGRSAVQSIVFGGTPRSEEHTSELQSHSDLVCRLLLEKKKIKEDNNYICEM